MTSPWVHGRGGLFTPRPSVKGTEEETRVPNLHLKSFRPGYPPQRLTLTLTLTLSPAGAPVPLAPSAPAWKAEIRPQNVQRQGLSGHEF